MKTLLSCIASLLLGVLGTWFVMRPAFGEHEREFYNEMVRLHAQVAAGHPYSQAYTVLEHVDLEKIIKQMGESEFENRSRGLMVAFSHAHEPGGAAAFKTMAENFFATYASRMP